MKQTDVIKGPLDPAEPMDWISNVVVTEKRDTGKIRMNIDLRHVNLAIQESHIPVPTMHNLRHQLNGSSVFSKLDLRHSFHQMLLGKKPRQLTNFYTPQGIYRFKRLVMGAGPASQEFHERFRRNLVGYEGVLQIEDDLLVYGKDQNDHDTHLIAILGCLSEMGVTLSKNKCEWSKSEAIWFGYRFDKDGMSQDPKKIKAIVDLPSPKSVSELKSFLQMCQFNAMFMYNSTETYSDVTAPLRNLLKKDIPFIWNRNCENSIKKLKDALTSDRVMSHWAQDRPTKLFVDRGPEGIAATLFQQDLNTCHWHTVNYASCALTDVEKKYAVIEGESLAILFGITVSRMFLYGMKFEVVTDHQPLVSLYNNPKQTGPVRVEQHRLKLQGYNFTVKYQKASLNPTDYNSRHPIPLQECALYDQESLSTQNDIELFVNRVIDQNIPDAVTLKILLDAANASDTLASLKYCILNKTKLPEKPELKPYHQVFHELTIASQLILRGERILIPDTLIPDVLSLAHEGHQGETKMKQYLRSRLWFPRMDKLIEDCVKTCHACLASTPVNNYQPLKPSVLAEGPWQKLAMDFKGPVGQQFYFLSVIDEFSRFPEVEIVESTAADIVLPRLDRILSTHGIPKRIKSDNGPPFNSQDMKTYAAKRRFKHQQIIPE